MVDDKIELRSEKVRHIIGEIPSKIVRYGWKSHTNLTHPVKVF